MPQPLRRLPSLVVQTAAHLRAGFQSGRWIGQLPGVVPLAKELRVSKDIVRAAVKLLEEEGRLEECGTGRRRRIITQPSVSPKRRVLRIGILPYLPLMTDDLLTTSILLSLQHRIEMAGHACVFSKRSLMQIKDNLASLSRCVESVAADAWIVFTASRVVLKWFVARDIPVFAYGGRFQNLPVASSSLRIGPAIKSAVQALVDHGHRRIVLLLETHLRQPTLIPSAAAYLSFLESHGITPTSYNLPHFEDNAEGLERCLVSLFSFTPPTALIVHQVSHCVAVLSFLAHHGLRMPQDVSIICMTNDPTFHLCLPPIDHFQAPHEKYIVEITRWVDGVANGQAGQRQVPFNAVYVPGGTVGPAKS